MKASARRWDAVRVDPVSPGETQPCEKGDGPKTNANV